ncbi:MAG: DUF2934 domain-containing protein [Candidatus Omnitrophica bacterium]|nr:DUF2934 domain-containing protein [Candidatus Omnitrophota bacterium]
MGATDKKRGIFSRVSKGSKKGTSDIKAAHHGINEAKLNQMIREQAYFLWEKQGRPQGQDFSHWVKAEKEIVSRGKK